VSDPDYHDGVYISRKWLVALVVLPLIILGVTFAAIIYDRSARANDRQAENRETQTVLCREIENLKSSIRVTVTRSVKTLPKLAYYQQHPSELANAQQQNRAVLKRFAKRDCDTAPPKKKKGS
jgi:predicted membrane chloride channel (bestrophin family)